MSVNGYKYFSDYLDAVLELVEEHIIGTPDKKRFESTIYQQWWGERSVRDAARRVLCCFAKHTAL